MKMLELLNEHMSSYRQAKTKAELQISLGKFLELKQQKYVLQNKATGRSSEENDSFKALQEAELDYLIGKCHIACDEWEEAIISFQQHLVHSPQDDDAFENVGMCYENLKQPRAASQWYTKAISQNPQNWSARHNRARLFIENQKFDLAIQDLQAALEVVPQNVFVLNSLAGCYLNKGSKIDYLNTYALCFQAAVVTATDEDFVEQLKSKISDMDLALIYEIMQKFDDARSIYRKMLGKFANASILYLQIGATYQKEKNYKQAIQSYDEGLKVSPLHPLYGNKAECLFSLKKYKQSFVNIKSARNIDPEDEEYVAMEKEAAAGMIAKCYRTHVERKKLYM